MEELEKPKPEQLLTVDHVLEATSAAQALRKREIVTAKEEEKVRRAIVDKFKSGVIDNTVAPRKLARLARAVEREEVSSNRAHDVVVRLFRDPKYSIDDAFRDSVEQVDFEHTLEQLSERLIAKLEEHKERGYEMGESLRGLLNELVRKVRSL